MTQAKSEKVVQEIRRKTRRWFSYTLEPAVINGHLLNQLLLDSKIQLLKFVGEVIAVDQIDGRSPVPSGLLDCRGGKSSGRDEQSLVRSSNHGPTKVADGVRRYGTLIFLALKQDVKTHEPMDSGNAFAVNSTVSRPTCHLNLHEPRLPQKPLRQSLERRRIELHCEDAVKLLTPFGICVRSFVGRNTLGLALPLRSRLTVESSDELDDLSRIDILGIPRFRSQRPDPAA